ncbi:DUF1156 domain-containing protein [Halosegnis longus]|uniref:DUF1156 domain-containing protein n=1 Tax=Halosegnis longus TaxID=2216012 RepID=UPI00129E6A2C|nr:DUF1156 domain-containing protein [Halosegnis longus]
MARQEHTPAARTPLPIEQGFPIEKINEIAEKEGRAKRHYRPIYTMHKWWARRLGCVFRSISLYSLLNETKEIDVREPGANKRTLTDFDIGSDDIDHLLESVTDTDPESLWELYPKDVRVNDTKVLDPFMGGGTSLVEASRFGADVVGNDLNPVAWFVVKKELEAGRTDLDTLDAAFESVKDAVAEELTAHYQTACPNADDDGHTADVMHYLWVKEVDCVSCDNTVSLFSDYRVAKGRFDHGDEYNVFCPHCEQLTYVDDWRSDSTCDQCHHSFRPDEGTVHRGEYSCRDCGQKYGVTDAIAEQDGYSQRLYAVEYYCDHCDERGYDRSDAKGYKAATDDDKQRYAAAAAEWAEADDLRDYIPQEPIPEGAITSASSISGNDVFQHGYEDWKDMFNDRQLLVLSKLLRAISNVEDENAQEYLFLAFSDMLRFNNMMVGYQASRNHINDLFQTNSFDPQSRPAEANPWGTAYGMGNFQKNWAMVRDGVEYAAAPTERYIVDGDTQETEPFETPIGESFELRQGDMRTLPYEDEFDAVITDPPYYDNIIYSEVADYFYVWQKLLLEDRYEGFDQEQTPRLESIVTNPFLDKTSEDFESELHEAFSVIRNTLKSDGVLAFTYHHSDSDSWGELLESLCDVGFEVTRTYPVSADVKKFITGEAVSFDIIVVARPIAESERTGISWRRLRRDIYEEVRTKRRELMAERELSRGDIGVMEMGACFQMYSRHHGKVTRDGDIMSAKDAVEEIYGLIQEASEIGEIDVFIDLLQEQSPDYSTVNKLCRGTNASPDDLKRMQLFSTEDGFALGTWQNDRRYRYIEDRVNSEGTLTALDKLQFLRRRFEEGKTVQNYVDKWEIDDDVHELADRLAAATGDDTYQRVLGDRDISSFGG